jgi:hypothetical protein
MKAIKFFFLLAFICCLSESYGQRAFFTTCPGTRGTRFINWKDHYLLCGFDQSFNLDSSHEALQFTELDKSGKIIFKNSYFIPTFENDTFIVNAADGYSLPFCVFRNHLITAPYLYSKNGKIVSVLLMMNDSFSTSLKTQKLYDGCGATLVYRLLPVSDNELIVFGRCGAGSYGWAFVAAYDSLFNLKWQKDFPNSPAQTTPGNIIKTRDGFIITLLSQSPAPSSAKDYSGSVLFLDSVGNTLNTISVIGTSSSVDNLLITQMGQKYLASWNDDYVKDPDLPYPDLVLNDNSTIWLMLLDEKGKVAWKKSLKGIINDLCNIEVTTTDPINTEFITTQKTEAVLSGGANFSQGNNLGYLMAFDSLGKMLWFRTYYFGKSSDSSWGSSQVFNSVQEADDEGLLIGLDYTGEFSENNPDPVPKAIALKLGKDGCFEEDCGIFSGIDEYTPIGRNTLRIFPIPSSDFIQVDLPANGAVYEYKITNSAGVMAGTGELKNMIIDISRYKSGLYLLQINNLAGNKSYQGKFIKR